MRLLLALILCFVAYSGNAVAQIDTAWIRDLAGSTQGAHSGNAIWSMPDGGAVVAGGAPGQNGKSDILTSRISKSGEVLWTRLYDGPSSGSDAGRLVQADSAGNSYVVGSFESAQGRRNIVLLRYSPDGDLDWVRQMDSTSGSSTDSDSVTAMCFDSDGNVIMVGAKSVFQWYQMLFVRKYRPDGELQWHREYDYSGNFLSHDIPLAVVADSANNLYIAAATETPDWDFLLLKYRSNGNRQWVRLYDSPWHGDDQATAIAVDRQGYVYVTGSSEGDGGSIDYLTLKYDSLGVRLWTRRFIGQAGGDDVPVGIGVDDAGAIYVGGRSRGFFSFEDFHIIKYDTGSIPVWDRQYTGPGFSVEVPNSFRVTPSGISYISGASSQSSTSWEFATVSFDSAGFLRWERRYGASMNDSAASMHLDDSGNVFVAGNGSVASASDIITVIKYSPCDAPAAVNPPVASTITPCAGEQFTLTWSPSPGATSYELYEDGGFVAAGPDTFRTLSRASGSFAYTVRARHPACGVSGYSGIGPQISVQCSCHGDSNCDGAINVVDVTSTINEAFRGVGATADPGCSNDTRNDVDCDCVVSLTDIIRVINVAFRGGNKATEFCNPCAATCP